MIEVCIGCIASGKSLWAAQRAKDDFVIINDDSIVKMIHGGDYLAYRKELKPLYKSIEDHILHTALAMGKDVLIDRGVDVRKSSRRRWIDIAKSCDKQIRAISFEVFSPEVHARRRYNFDSRGHSLQYWLDTAYNHWNSYDEPTKEEGFYEIIKKKWENMT